MSEEITDPKLLRYLKKTSKATSTGARPDITLLERKVHKIDRTVSLIMDGKPVKLEGDVMEVYKCNKCNNKFNHPHAKIVSGLPPKCPRCD